MKLMFILSHLKREAVLSFVKKKGENTSGLHVSSPFETHRNNHWSLSDRLKSRHAAHGIGRFGGEKEGGATFYWCPG